VADREDPQRDRHTRNAAKAWSVDKIASPRNEDRLEEREREGEGERKSGDEVRRDERLKERDVEREGDSWKGKDGTKAILEIRAKGSGTCGPRAIGRSPIKSIKSRAEFLREACNIPPRRLQSSPVHAGWVDPPDDFQFAVYGTH